MLGYACYECFTILIGNIDYSSWLISQCAMTKVAMQQFLPHESSELRMTAHLNLLCYVYLVVIVVTTKASRFMRR